jgi:Zn2+/Cd2+-exporting ATPase
MGWEPFSDSLYRAMTIMVAASPCAIVISTPATVLSAIGNGARRGILFKGGIYVENAAGIKVIAFDKTGTLTAGKPEMTDLIRLDEAISQEELLLLTAAVEARSEHPLAQAVVRAAEAAGLTLPKATGFTAEVGRGVEAEVNGRHIRIGNGRYFQDMATPIWISPRQRPTSLKPTARPASSWPSYRQTAGGRGCWAWSPLPTCCAPMRLRSFRTSNGPALSAW